MSEKQNPKDDAKAKPESSAKPAPKPSWQEPDYDGPLNSEQAAWRNAHIDRLGDRTTKPAKAGETK